MSSAVSAEIAATCSALGYFDDKTNKYYADSNTLETIKDLIRYLRRDDETYEIRRKLGETKVLQTDLLPLLKNYYEESDLFDVLLRLIMNLTTPPLLLWNYDIPKDKTLRNLYLQIEDHLKSYKEAFADEGVWSVLSTRLSKILEVEGAERSDENTVKIERILVLIRNILFVPADIMEKRPDNDASVHDQVLWALHQSGMLDIILYMMSSSAEQAYHMYTLEIIHFMLREQQPNELAIAALQRSHTEKIRDEAELLAIRHKETTQKQIKSKMYTSSRHSRFGGTYVVKSMRSISDNDLIYHKPLNKLDSLDFDTDKRKLKTPKNRMPIVDTSLERRSAFTIRLFLKDFCIEFLNGSYNILMHHVKDNLARAGGESHDESYYFWAVRFFMAFNRSYKFEVKLVSETMSVQMFHYVQQQSEQYFDLMQTDKKRLLIWSRRLHTALLAYRELFHTLCAMDKAPDGTVRDSAKVIKSNILYVPEYREFILTLLIAYDPLKMSNLYLKDLIETQHVFIKMFESFCGKEGSVVVQKKAKTRRKKSMNPMQTAKESQEQKLEQSWDESGPQLSAVLEAGGDFLVDVVPFDAASDVPIDEQKADAMKKIQVKLRNVEFENAIGLLRAAREVWPENDSFGSNNMSPEEEYLALREIFFADLGDDRAVQQTIEDDTDENEEDEDENENQYSETTLSFNELIKRLPHPKIVKACCLALKSFETNSVNTNHCILKLLHRIAFDCKMYVMVFQLSMFRTFQRIFSMKELSQYKELVKFATYIMRQFFKVAEINDKVFIEALFWKSQRDAYEIESGYGSYSEQSKAAAKLWSDQEEDELRKLFIEHRNNQIEEDVVDWITSSLIDNTRTRRMVLKKLKEMHLLMDYKPKRNVKYKAPQNWSEEEVTQLKELFEEFKDAIDPMGCIMPRLEIIRPKNRVIEKMLVLGLVQDKKELRKKRMRSNKSGKSRSEAQTSQQDNSMDSDTDSDSSLQRLQTNKNPARNRKAPVKKRPVPIKTNRTELTKLLLENMECEQQSALEWLKDSISDAIEDLEDDSNEGIPLVPIMDYAELAMENPKFQKLLKAIGICEPFDEQETYWRIPGDVSVESLKGYSDLIQSALDNTLNIEEESEINLNGNEIVQQNDDDSSDDDYLEKLIQNRTKVAQKNTNKSLEEDIHSPEKPNLESETTVAQENSNKSREENIENSPEQHNIDDSVQNEIMEHENGDSEKLKPSVHRKGRAIIESDSEDEIDQGSTDVSDKVSKRSRSNSNSESEKPSKKIRVIESDSENERDIED